MKLSKEASVSDSTNEPRGVTAQLCDWIQNLHLHQVPQNIRTRAKYLILDGIACAIVGAHVPWSEQAVSATTAFEPPGNATVFGHQSVRLFQYL